MATTVRPCKHCGCSMSCKTSRKAFCNSNCRVNHHNNRSLSNIVQMILDRGVTKALQTQGIIHYGNFAYQTKL